MILVGQTPLAIRFSTRPFAAIEARLAARVHVGPIGVDEAQELLASLRPGREWTLDEVETLHRDASGNPRKLLRLVGPGELARAIEEPRPAISQRTLTNPPLAVPAGSPTVPSRTAVPHARTVAANASPAPLMGPAKPPIFVEENMIEVGWAAEEASLEDGSDAESSPKLGTPGSIEGGEEAVKDHYAALQAWQEWTENQARRAPRPAEVFEDEHDEIEDDDGFEMRTAPSPDRPTIRAEGEQKFAPFGHLFSRMAQALEPELPNEGNASGRPGRP